MLTSNLLDGKTLAESQLKGLEETVRTNDLDPSLHVILVGEDEASESYIRMKAKKASRVGIATEVHRFPTETSQQEVTTTLLDLNDNSQVDGIIIQLPLPERFDTQELLESVKPRKDVDGLHPVNFGTLLGGGTPYFFPPTPLGILTLLDEYDVPLEGETVVLVGMGRLVGRPLSQMVLNRQATVLCLNEYSPDLTQFTRKGDVVVVATGQPQLLGQQHVKPDTVVVDAGIHRVEGELVGDVKFDEVVDKAKLITPVPGGVGPLTVAGLLENTVLAARNFS